MQLSEKQNNYSKSFVPFMESTANFKLLKKKMMVLANVFSKLQTVKNIVTPLCKKRRFGTRLDSRHVKLS